MSSSPADVVRALLSNPRDPINVTTLVAKDATYVSLSHGNPDLKKILPYSGPHPNAGPEAILSTFATVNEIWATEAFDVETIFGEGEHVAVFGTFTYRSRNLGRAASSPFSIWATVKGGKVAYMQFMEDTLASTSTFRTGGKAEFELVGGDKVTI